MLPPADRPVTLAAIAGAHGVTGEVRLKLFCAGVDSIRRHWDMAAGGKALTLLSVREGAGGAIARFAEVCDRTAAEALRGELLTVPRASLPPLAEGEHYWHDLIGLPVEGADGAALGIVVSVENFGASDLLEIALAGGRRVLVPLVPAAARVEPARVVVEEGWLV
jgi:16S rRNA processing protein RimM